MSIADRVLDDLGPTFRARAGALLATLVGALTSELDAVDEMVQPTGHRGWAAAFDLDATPQPAWLGQVSGTIVPAGLTVEQQRDYVRDRPQWNRGTPAAIKAAVATLLTGPKHVRLAERWPSTAGELKVFIWAPEGPAVTASQVIAAANTMKPVGIVVDAYVVPAYVTYAHVAERYPTYADLAAQVGTYEDLLYHVHELDDPEE